MLIYIYIYIYIQSIVIFFTIKELAFPSSGISFSTIIVDLSVAKLRLLRMCVNGKVLLLVLILYIDFEYTPYTICKL